MSLPQVTITPAGFAAIVNAEHDGTAPVRISHVGVTPQAFNVDTVGAALPGEIKRISTFGGKAVAVDTLHLNIRDDSTDTYTLRGFGLYLSNGVLFAVYSQATPIMEKAAAATLLLATDIRFAKITATSIEVGDVDFVNPPATTTQVGVSRFATDQESAAGSSGSVGMTPKGVAAYINGRFGEGAPSAFIKTLMTKATAALLRAALELKSASLKDEGSNNGLDADLLDGNHGSHYLAWTNLTGVPTRFPPSPHSTEWGDVINAPEFSLSNHKHDIYLLKTGGDVNGPINMRGSSAGRIRLFDDNNDVANIEVVAGLNNASDRHSVIINRNESGALALWGRNGGCQLTVGSEADLNTMTGGLSAKISTGLGTNGGNSLLFQDWRGHSGNGDFLSVRLVRRQNGSGWATAAWRIGRTVDVTPQGYIDLGGESESQAVLIGNASGGRAWLSVSGSWHCPGGFDSGSSRKLKNIEGVIPYGLSEVKATEIMVGKYKPEYANDGRRRLFFIAEQLAELMPEVVSKGAISFNGEDVDAVQMEQLVPVAFNAIKQLSKIVEAIALDVEQIKGSN